MNIEIACSKVVIKEGAGRTLPCFHQPRYDRL